MTPPQIYKGNAQVINSIPLAPQAGSTTSTRKFVVRWCGPIELRPGDRVLVSYREQLDNNNRNAGDAWAEPVVSGIVKTGSGKQNRKTKAVTAWPTYAATQRPLNVDPRWTLWCGYNLGVIRTTSPSATTGTDVIRALGGNWDNWMHHQPDKDCGWDVVTENVPAAYYVTVCWFDTTPQYLLPGQTIEVTPRGSIEAALYR